ncbi:hypothetical protein [Sphingomonas oligophenolica]|uniref:Uncharacterized protein n=1 Tax=Sphingomonas oligophenolica TaxID=301154 RepID=A0A502CH11_9SPHN|nr:hypothetical protein [Sphingomonas oligophenolica]TPG12093.1 hypothetical protein EAH84_10055 [Sphingomonas oligophenolica]
MTDQNHSDQNVTGGSDDPPDSVPTRRRLLQLGAIGAGAVVSIRPALAQTAGSVLNCEIPVPDAGHAGGFIADDGSVVAAGTKGAFAPPGRPFKGEEVKRAMAGNQLPGTSYESNRAYTNYIRRLQRGQGGFTCFASLQMPRG